MREGCSLIKGPEHSSILLFLALSIIQMPVAPLNYVNCRRHIDKLGTPALWGNYFENQRGNG